MLTLALLFSPALAQDVLPVERVRFYETGVAWFERAGEVRDATRLPVPTSHLDDALKSLVVLGGEVDVGAITFPSAVGEDAARVAAGLDGNDRVAFEEALHALLGAEVSVRVGTRELRGALLDVERLPDPPAPKEGPVTRVRPEYALTLLDAEGGLHRVDSHELSRIQTEEEGLASRLDSAARTLAKTRAQREAALGLQLAEGGELALGYLAEAPVWRVSYRVLQGPEEAQLQAWALVHNDTDESWKDVQVELANGEPDSFLFPLAAPRYLERELKTPDQWMSTVPQLAADTPDGMWTGEVGAAYGSGGMGSYGSGMGGGGSSYGVAGVATYGAAQLKQAEPVQTPTQFVYRVARPLDLPAHHSALVPLVHDAIDTEPGVAFTPGSSSGRTSLWLTNSTSRTLPEGVLSVVEAGGLAGEAELERLKPEEQQMLLIGNELDIDVKRYRSTADAQWTRFDFHRGQVRLASTQVTTEEVRVTNRSGRSRPLWLAYELGASTDVGAGLRWEVDPHRGWTWVVHDVEDGASSTEVAWTQRHERRGAPEEFDAETYRAVAEAGIGPTDRLLAAAAQMDAVTDARSRLVELRAQTQRAEAQLEGLRKDLEAAAGGDGTVSLARKTATVEVELRRLSEKAVAQEAEIDALIAELPALLTGEVLATNQP
ncbi:MAG: hypothetical protein EP330_09100 [Deltaproteobacteria bacterium]|nr:MAG: hypothetical protein EP330_09100 [Deltaproteobacteria bacterium]